MDNVQFSEVIAIQTPWDYMLYFVMFFQVIVLALLFNGSLRDVIMLAIVVVCAIADKAYLFGYLTEGAQTIQQAVDRHPNAFGTFLIRTAIAVFPLLITTQTKIKKARPIVGFLGIVSLIYVIVRGFIENEWIIGDRTSG